MCAGGYGKGTGNTCHSCEDATSRVLIAAGSVFFLAVLMLLFVAVVFLIGGLDAVDSVRQSVASSLSISGRPATHELPGREIGSSESIAAARSGGPVTLFPAGAGRSRSGSFRAFTGVTPFAGVAPIDLSEDGDCEGESAGPHGTVGGGGAQSSAVAGRGSITRSERAPAGGRANLLGAGIEKSDDGERGRPGCCGRLGERLKRLALRVPLDKLKILVVVWQILTVFPSVTGVDYPPVYARFLSWIDVVNFDVGNIFSASCALPFVDFYQRLLLTTLAPIGLGAVLVLTYWMAKRRAGIGSAGVLARRAAWSRHMAAGLLLTFLVSLLFGGARKMLHTCVSGFCNQTSGVEQYVTRAAVDGGVSKPAIRSFDPFHPRGNTYFGPETKLFGIMVPNAVSFGRAPFRFSPLPLRSCSRSSRATRRRWQERVSSERTTAYRATRISTRTTRSMPGS